MRSHPSKQGGSGPWSCTAALCIAFALALSQATPSSAELVDYDYDPDALPKPVLDGHEEWIRLYYAAWDLAADNINFAAPGTGFVSEYMDEALTDNKVWQWDTLFITMFAKYSNGELPIMDGVDNFYRKQRRDGFICPAYSARRTARTFTPTVRNPGTTRIRTHRCTPGPSGTTTS